MPIFEVTLMYSVNACWFVTDVLDDKLVDDALAEFNDQLASGREHANALYRNQPNVFPLAIRLTVDTDGDLEPATDGEKELIALFEKLAAFLFGRFKISSKNVVLSEITQRERGRGDPIIVSVTLDELFGRAPVKER